MDTQIINDLWNGYLEVTEALVERGMLDDSSYVEPERGDSMTASEESEEGMYVYPGTQIESVTWLHSETHLESSNSVSEDTQFSCEASSAQPITIRELTAAIREKRKLLPPMQVGSRGQLLEWRKEYREFEQGHRHISHLYGLYPANQITQSRTPELIKAAAKTIEERLAHGGGQTGWSLGWIINMYARLGDGEAALRSLERLLQEQTAANLFDLHPPVVPGTPPIFQIDGNLGGTAGIMEMLLQSHEGCLHFLPALPRRWSSGRVRGLVARGNICVDFEWRDGRVTNIVVKSPVEQAVDLTVNGRRIKVLLKAGAETEVSCEEL